MSRRQARESALQALFQMDFNKPSGEEEQEAYETLAIDTALCEAGEPLGKADRAYLQSLVVGVHASLPQIDKLILECARGWSIERMAAVDRTVMRIAVFEMCFASEKLPAGVAINEAVELAKRYGTDNSARYVNGVLDTLSKSHAEN